MKKLLSIVVPCYNEEPALQSFYKAVNEVSQEMSSLDFEFVFVDDGSRDGTMREIEKLRAKDERDRKSVV